MTLEALKTETVVNLSQSTASLWVWTPEEDNKARVFEGIYQAGRLRHGKIRLRNLAGHGGELRILSDAERYPLGIRCLDTGYVGGFLPAMLGKKDAQLSLLQDKSAEELGDSGYSLFEWIAGESARSQTRAVARFLRSEVLDRTTLAASLPVKSLSYRSNMERSLAWFLVESPEHK